MKTAFVAVQDAKSLQPLTGAAPGSGATQPVASQACVGSPPSVSWMEPARRARIPLTSVAKSAPESPWLFSGFQAKPIRPVAL